MPAKKELNNIVRAIKGYRMIRGSFIMSIIKLKSIFFNCMAIVLSPFGFH
jgi:hypothetical protein